MQIGRTFSALLLAALLSGCDGSTTAPQIIDRIDAVSGDSQGAPAGTVLPNPLVVAVSGPNGEAIVGVHIAWRVTSGDGTVSSALTTTGGDGRTQVTWTLGKTRGLGTVTATINENGVPDSYSATFAAIGT
jgi:hypothetical protein